MLTPEATSAIQHTLQTVLLAVLCIPCLAVAGMLLAKSYTKRKPLIRPKKRKEIIRAGFKIGGFLGLVLVWPIYRAFI